MTVRDMAKREKKRAIRFFVDEHIQAHHMSPSMSGIAEAIGINKTTAWRYLKEMDETGEVSGIRSKGKRQSEGSRCKSLIFARPRIIIAA